MRRHFDRAIRVYQGPESQWPLVAEEPAPEPMLTDSPESITQALVPFLIPFGAQGGMASVRARTQLRLLRLHAWVLAYRWEHDRLPSTLRDAVGDEAAVDPVNLEPFEYTVNPSGYRLVSKGRGALGEVALRYVRPPSQERGDAPPPAGKRR